MLTKTLNRRLITAAVIAAVAAAGFCLIGASQNTYAASKKPLVMIDQTSDFYMNPKLVKKVNGKYFRLNKKGHLLASSSKNGKYRKVASDECAATDGVYVYEIPYSEKKNICYIRRTSIKTGKKKTLKKLPITHPKGFPMDSSVSWLDDAQGSTLYIGRDAVDCKYDAYTFNLKTNKMKKILKGRAVISHSGKYFICDSDRGGIYDLRPAKKIYLYKKSGAKLKFVKILARKATIIVAANHHFYWIDNKYNLYSATEKGAVRKIRKLADRADVNLTSTYAEYTPTLLKEGEEVHTYRYIYKTGKTKVVK